MRLPLLVFTLVATALAQNGNFPRLSCNRLQGNYVTCCEFTNVAFGRPLMPGDRIIVNGTINPTYYLIRFVLRDNSGKFLLHFRTAMYHDTPPRWNELLYTTMTRGPWSTFQFGPNPYVQGQPIQLSITYTGSAYLIHSGDKLLMNYIIPYPPEYPIQYLELNGDWTTNWIQLDCDSMSSTAPTTTKRRRPPRPPHHSSESDSGNEEFCE